MRNLIGLTDHEKIEELIKEINKVTLTVNTELPVGTIILRKNEKTNAGMSYGNWIPSNDTVNTANGILIQYIRVD